MKEIVSSKNNSYVDARGERQSGLAQTTGDDQDGNHARSGEEATACATPIVGSPKYRLSSSREGFLPLFLVRELAARFHGKLRDRTKGHALPGGTGEGRTLLYQVRAWPVRFTYGGLRWISRTSHEFTIMGRVDGWMFYVQSAKAAKL